MMSDYRRARIITDNDDGTQTLSQPVLWLGSISDSAGVSYQLVADMPEEAHPSFCIDGDVTNLRIVRKVQSA